MKMEKILNSWGGIVLAVLASLVAGRIVSIFSWTLARIFGYIVLGGGLVLALAYIRNRN